jgi:hypothetical protein
MDPVTTTLVSAFVAGAAKGAVKVGDQAVTDAYAVLKSIVMATYQHATELLHSITGLEAKPESPGRRDTLAEELEAVRAVDNPTLVAAAEAVIAAAEKLPSMLSIGIDWQDVRAARLKVGEIRARAGAIGFRAARMEITGEVEISGIDVSGAPGK